MEIGGRRPEPAAAFLDDVDRAYVVAQLEGAMDDVVELEVSLRQASSLLLPGDGRSERRGADDARRAEQLGREIAALIPKVTVTVVAGEDDLPELTVKARGTGPIRFLGVPRVNLFRALLEAIRRASTHEHGFEPRWARDLRALPADVHAAVFATPT